MIEIERVDHIGVRVADRERALKFYEILGFKRLADATDDAVTVIRNAQDVEVNLIYNSNNDNRGKNILMDVDDKYPGFTHLALRVRSIRDTIVALADNDIKITQGPVAFGRGGHVSVFIRDPDLNVIELRGRAEDLSAINGVIDYVPEN